MKLRAYLKLRGLTTEAFGTAIGVSQNSVSRYVLGMRVPRKDVMRKIRLATDGAVTADDFMDEPPFRKVRARRPRQIDVASVEQRP